MRKIRRRSLRIQNYPASSVADSVTAENHGAEELFGDTDMYGSKWLLDSDRNHSQKQQIPNDLNRRPAAAEDSTCSRFLHCTAQTAGTSADDVFHSSKLHYSDQQQEKTSADSFLCGEATGSLNKAFNQSEHFPAACIGDTLHSCESKEKLCEHQLSTLVGLSSPKMVLDSEQSFVRHQLQHACSISTENSLFGNTQLSLLPNDVETIIPMDSSNTASDHIRLYSDSDSSVQLGSSMIGSTSTCCSVGIVNCVSAVCHSNEELLSAHFDTRSNLIDKSSGVDVQLSSGSQENRTLGTGNSDGHTVENINLSTHHYDGETNSCKLNTVVGNTGVPLNEIVISDTTVLHQHGGFHTEQKPSVACLMHSISNNYVNKHQAAKIRKERRRSAFGSEFKLTTCAHQGSPPNSDSPGALQELEFPVQNQCIQNSLPVSPCQSQSATCTTNDGNVQPVVTVASEGQVSSSSTEDLQIGNVRDGSGEAGLLVTDSFDQKSASGQELQHLQPKSKRKKRMSADIFVTAPNTLMSANEDCHALDQSDGCVVEKSVFTNKRSSLRLLRRQSYKFALSGAASADTETSSNTAQSGSSEIPVSTGRRADVLTEMHGDVCADLEEPAETVISPELENLYRNKNYKKPADRTWETIFECPSKGRMTSKQKWRRYLPFEDTISMSKFKRRWKKAIQNGWDAASKIPKQTSDQEVKQKLQKLDEEISNA